MHDDDGFAQGGGHPPANRLPWFIAYFFNFGYPCYGQLTAVKTRESTDQPQGLLSYFLPEQCPIMSG